MACKVDTPQLYAYNTRSECSAKVQVSRILLLNNKLATKSFQSENYIHFRTIFGQGPLQGCSDCNCLGFRTGSGFSVGPGGEKVLQQPHAAQYGRLLV